MTGRLRLVHSYKDYYPPVIGGMERHMAAVCTHFAEEYDVTAVVCARGVRTRERDEAGVRVIEVPSVGRLRSAPLPVGYGRALRRLEPHLLHFHMPNPTCELAALRAAPSGRWLATYHSDIVRQRLLLHLYAPYLRRFLDRLDVIVATTPHYVETSPYLQAMRHKIRLIPIGIDTAHFASLPDGGDARVDELEARFGAPFLLFVGRLRYYKGLHVLIEAMREVDAPLVIVGTGGEEQALRAQAQRAGVDARVHFLGDVDDDMLRCLYHACAVFVLPSTARSEAYGLVQLEAHCAGKPVVSTRLRTGVEFINADGETGLTVPPGDVPALARALTRLLQDRDYATQLGAQARERACAEFDERLMFERLGALYRELLER